MLADMVKKSRQPKSSRDKDWLGPSLTAPSKGMHRNNIAGIPWGEIELEPEVSVWLDSLDDDRWAQALFHLDLLERRGVYLGEPYTRQLVGKLRELRFYCGGERIRITYWIAPGRRIIALTVFTKTRMRESAEVGRAQRALARCLREGHTPDEDEDERYQR
jgi:hypothetical protein